MAVTTTRKGYYKPELTDNMVNSNAWIASNYDAIDHIVYYDEDETINGNWSFASGINVASGEYINYGDIQGESGYGIRELSGELQYKPSGGDWESFLIASDITVVINGLDDVYFRLDGTTPLVSGAYINWGETPASGGYGIRCDNGNIQFKHFGGEWADIGGGSSLPSGTQGSILYHDGATWVALPPGIDEFVLVNPDWVDRTRIPAIQKNQIFRWVFKMVDSLDFATPETGKSPAVTLSKDGAGFAALTGPPAVAEIGNGWYYVDAPAADINIDAGVLKATAAGCAQTDFAFYPEI
jgi:hypothetical protein